MNNFVTFSGNGDKKIAIRADRIVSALELDNGGCYIHTDDGGEYEISNLMDQFLEIMTGASKTADELTVSDIYNGLEESDRQQLFQALNVLKNIGDNDVNIDDETSKVIIVSAADKAFDAVVKRDYKSASLHIDYIDEELSSISHERVSQEVRDALESAFYTVRSLLKEV